MVGVPTARWSWFGGWTSSFWASKADESLPEAAQRLALSHGPRRSVDGGDVAPPGTWTISEGGLSAARPTHASLSAEIRFGVFFWILRATAAATLGSQWPGVIFGTFPSAVSNFAQTAAGNGRRLRDSRERCHGRVQCRRLRNSGNMPRKPCVGPANPRPNKRNKP